MLDGRVASDWLDWRWGAGDPGELVDGGEGEMNDPEDMQKEIVELFGKVERLTRERDEARAALEHDEVYEDVLMRAQALRVERDALLAEVRARRSHDDGEFNGGPDEPTYNQSYGRIQRLRAENEKRGLV